MVYYCDIGAILSSSHAKIIMYTYSYYSCLPSSAHLLKLLGSTRVMHISGFFKIKHYVLCTNIGKVRIISLRTTVFIV